MSGPPYPRPDPATSGIGEFIIGVSPIGTQAGFDWWATVISQYANSDRLTSMIGSFFDAIDQTADFDLFFDDVQNIDTAIGEGLDVWGRRLGVSRVIDVVTAGVNFGFEEAGLSPEPFNVAPFYVGAPLTTSFALTDDAFRVLLFAKALANISDGSSKSINRLLMTLFPGRGNAYVTDGLDMTMTYTFQFTLTAVEQAIIGQSGVIPRPSGVSATIVQA